VTGVATVGYLVVGVATMVFGQRLAAARHRAGLSQDQIAAIVGKTRQAVSKWERDEAQPSQEDLLRLSDALGVSVAYLLGETDDPRRPEDILAKQAMPVTPIPILGVIHAGDPIPAEEHIIGWTAIPEDEARGGRFFALKAKGDCFYTGGPKSISEGDIVIVRQQPDCENGQIAVVLWPDVSEAQLRRVYRRDGMVVLRADNPAYPPEVVKKRELTILGVVVNIVSEPAPAKDL